STPLRSVISVSRRLVASRIDSGSSASTVIAPRIPRIFIAAPFAALRRAYRLAPQNPWRVALEHIVMHVALCKAVARLAPRTAVAMRVVVSDKTGRPTLDRVVQFQRGTADTANVEFDSSRGIYRVTLAVPKYRCGGAEFMYVLPDHDRSLNVALSDNFVRFQVPIALVMGTLPVSFAYVQPTVVTF